MAEYNPFSPEVRANPYPFYSELRRDAPVYEVKEAGLWAVSRYDDVLAVARNHRAFSSEAMNFSVVREQYFGGDVATLIGSDPPVHTRLRNLVSRAFTPKRIAGLADRMRDLTADLLKNIEGRSAFDLMVELAIPLPVIVIAELLGVEPERRRDFKRWSDAIVGLISGSNGMEQLAGTDASMREFLAYLEDAMARRRVEPTDDLIGALVRAQAVDQKLTPIEVVAFTSLLLVAGNETTTNLIGNAIRALLDHPGELAKVRADPSLIPRVVEETLRYDGPVQGLFRITREPVELAGTTLNPGTMVMPLFASADRDERHFPEADRFNITRDIDEHIAFGFGIHFCLGAPLARLEAQVALEALLTKLPLFYREDHPIEYIDSIFLRGPKALMLRFD